jgi:hypothetical protein
MAAFDDRSEDRGREETATPAGGAGELPAEALPIVAALRSSLDRHRRTRRGEDLERAFAAASALVETLKAPGAGARPDLVEVRRLAAAVPEFGRFLSAAAGEADEAMREGAAKLWRVLGLSSAVPRWNEADVETARMLFAVACAQPAQTRGERLRAGLRQLGAARFAMLLCAELAGNEDAWRKALAGRYGNVRHRCARRTPWGNRGLAELIRADEIVRSALIARLERWMSDGAQLEKLPGELEAAVVHARTPARLA